MNKMIETIPTGHSDIRYINELPFSDYMELQQNMFRYLPDLGTTSTENVVAPKLNQGAKNLCICGCEKEITNFNKYGIKQKYIHGHNRRGYTKMFLTKEELKNLYINQKLNVISIGKKIGLPSTLIYRWLRKYGLKRLSKKPSKDKLIQLYINKKLNTVDIAKKLNTFQSTVYKWIKEYDIPMRTMSESKRKIRPKNELIECTCGCKQKIWKYDSRWIERRYAIGHGKNKSNKDGLINKERLEELYNTKKLSISYISKQTNLGIHTIYNYFKKYNIKLRTPAETWAIIKSRPKNELIFCKCGCGKQRWRYDRKWRKREYIPGHMCKTVGFQINHKTWNKNKTFEEMYGEEEAKIKREERIYHRSKQIFPTHDTSIEIKIQNYLKRLSVDFLTHQYMYQIKHSYQCDIYIPSSNTIIECDGDFFHFNPNKYKPQDRIFENGLTAQEKWDLDNTRTNELIEQGFKVLRLWENEIKVMDLSEFKKKLEC